jgi:hypothetical protein
MAVRAWHKWQSLAERFGIRRAMPDGEHQTTASSGVSQTEKSDKTNS